MERTYHPFIYTCKDKLEDMDVSLKMSASLSGPTLQTWITQKWLNIFKSLFLYMKIWDICDCLQLVSWIFFKWGHFEKKVFKNMFSAQGKNSDFWKNEKYSILTMRWGQTTQQHTTKKNVSLERWYPFEICPPVRHNGPGKSWLHVGRGKKWVIRPYPLVCPCIIS